MSLNVYRMKAIIRFTFMAISISPMTDTISHMQTEHRFSGLVIPAGTARYSLTNRVGTPILRIDETKDLPAFSSWQPNTALRHPIAKGVCRSPALKESPSTRSISNGWTSELTQSMKREWFQFLSCCGFWEIVLEPICPKTSELSWPAIWLLATAHIRLFGF